MHLETATSIAVDGGEQPEGLFVAALHQILTHRDGVAEGRALRLGAPGPPDAVTRAPGFGYSRYMAHVPRGWTVDEFLEWEVNETERFEYVGGIVYAMSGGTVAHSRVLMNIGAALWNAVGDGPCSVFTDTPKVVTMDQVAYPDVVVTCAPQDESSGIIAEPKMIFEVLSKSTEHRDRNEKWAEYQSIPSLQHYVLVDPARIRIESYTRVDDAWRYKVLDRIAESLPLHDFVLSVSDIYKKTSAAQANPST